MTPETAAMRPARKGPRLRQARPARGTGAGGRGNGGGTVTVARAASRTVVRANMVDELSGWGCGGTVRIRANPWFRLHRGFHSRFVHPGLSPGVSRGCIGID